jgi:phage-related protein
MKPYWEINLDNLVDNSSQFAGYLSSDPTDATNPYCGSLPDSFGIDVWNGVFYVGGSQIQSVEPTLRTNGDVLMIAYDRDSGLFWMGHNGVWWVEGDPATGVNPINPNNPIAVDGYPALTMWVNGSVATFHSGDNNNLSYPVPVGFSSNMATYGAPAIQLARNIDDVIWGGKTWLKCWFEVETITETTSGTATELQVSISNVGGWAEQQIIENDNFAGKTCTIYLVNSNCLDDTEPIFSITLDVSKPVVNGVVASLKLTAENPFLLSYPSWHFNSSICQYKDLSPVWDWNGYTWVYGGEWRGFKGVLCGYRGPHTDCNRTLDDCITRGNQARFGGQLGIRGSVIE